MKSLQVLTPKRECIFKCPFCIARTHKHNNNFKNNYEKNQELWKNNFIRVLNENIDLKYIVITGTNEPMQDKECVEEIINIAREYRKDIQIELQTRYYKYENVYDKLDVVAYSISDYKYLDKIQVSNTTNRYVVLLTNSFDNKTLKDILDAIPKGVTQLTFKFLHDSHGVNKDIDEWIKNNRMNAIDNNNLIKDINRYKGNLSVRYDVDCMISENRYMIYREDGKLYSNWEEV